MQVRAFCCRVGTGEGRPGNKQAARDSGHTNSGERLSGRRIRNVGSKIRIPTERPRREPRFSKPLRMSIFTAYASKAEHSCTKKAHFSEIFSGRYFANPEKATIFATQKGGLAQLARALAWHARGHEFESRILHQETTQKIANPCKSRIYRDFYFGRNAEKGIEKRVTCGLFGVLFPGPKKYTELLVTDWFAPVCSGLPLDMRHLGN